MQQDGYIIKVNVCIENASGDGLCEAYTKTETPEKLESG